MNSVFKKISLSALALSFVVSAQQARADQRTQTLGTVIGALSGAVIGNQVVKGKGQTVATIGGALIGGLIGNSIAQDFDDDDNQQSQVMWNQALRRDYSDSPYNWQGQGHRGRIVFNGEGYYDGYYCRSYRSEVWNRRADSPMVTRGYVCRGDDGAWFRREASQIVEERRDRPDRRQRDRGPRDDRQDDRRGDRRDPRMADHRNAEEGFPRPGVR